MFESVRRFFKAAKEKVVAKLAPKAAEFAVYAAGASMAVVTALETSDMSESLSLINSFLPIIVTFAVLGMIFKLFDKVTKNVG